LKTDQHEIRLIGYLGKKSSRGWENLKTTRIPAW